MNILIAGLGSIGRKHLAAIRAVAPEATVYALRSSGKSTHIDGVIDVVSIDEVADKVVDFAILATPTAVHAETAQILSALKCPILIEKPLSQKIDTAEAITVLMQSAGITTYIGCNLRFLGCLQYVKENLIRDGHTINEVNAYCGSFLPDWRPGVDFRKVYSAVPELGGGVHIDLIHELDYLIWMFGNPSEVRRTLRHQSSLGLDVCDYANYCLTYPSFCASVVLNYYRRDPRRTLEIVWDDETWRVDLLSNSVISLKDGRILYTSDERISDTMAAQMQYMIELVESHATTSSNTCADALGVLKICLGNES